MAKRKYNQKEEHENIVLDWNRDGKLALKAVTNDVFVDLNNSICDLDSSDIYIKYRLKTKNSLKNKLIKKSKDKKYANICPENYKSIIHDLGGIRILYISREDFKNINQIILNTKNCTILEKIAYIKGDQSEYVKNYYRSLEFEENKILTGNKQYSSVHYVLEYQNQIDETSKYYIEIQVRTLAEENYAQIDHKVRYPDDPKSIQLDNLLNALSNSATNLNSCVIAIEDFIDQRNIISDQFLKIKEIEKELNNKIVEIKNIKEKTIYPDMQTISNMSNVMSINGINKSISDLVTMNSIQPLMKNFSDAINHMTNSVQFPNPLINETNLLLSKIIVTSPKNK